jgi:hypothetical protein
MKGPLIMRNKLCKLALAAALLTGSLSLGLAPQPAHGLCTPICCNASCTAVRNCFGATCNICEATCHRVIQNL